MPTPLMDDIISTTLKNRLDRTVEELTRQMNLSMYGDLSPPSYSRVERVMMWMRLYRNRISDAWLVLIGRAYIGYD